MRAYELEESAVEELKNRLPKLKRHNYTTIDRLMQNISAKHKITGKKLHDMFVRKYGHTPDTWIKKFKKKFNEGQVLQFRQQNPLTPNIITQLKALSQTALELFWGGSYMPTAAQGQMAQLGKKEEKRLFDETNKRFESLGYEYSIHEEDSEKLFLHSIAREAWYDAEKPPNQYRGMPDLIYDAETNTLSYYDLIGDDGYEYTDTTQFEEDVTEAYELYKMPLYKRKRNTGAPRTPLKQFAELAAMLKISPEALRTYTQHIPGFPKPKSFIKAAYGSPAYFQPEEFKKWVIDNNIREKIAARKEKFGEGEVVPLKRPMSKIQYGKRVFPPKQRNVTEPEGNVTPLKKKSEEITESVNGPEDIQKIKDFVKWSIKTLNMQKPYPKITISKNTEVAQKGHHTGVHKGNEIWVYVGNRNLIDIFRTLFHELTHHRQMQLGMIKDGDSYPGSPIEMLADMAAGKYIKIYGKDHPEMFQ